MRTKFDASIASTPEVTSGVTDLFASNLDGSNTRHPSSGHTDSRRPFEASGIVPKRTLLEIICSDLDPTLREKAQDEPRDGQTTRLYEGVFQVGKNVPAPKEPRSGLSLVQ